MIDHAIQLALRTKLNSLEVATTGTMALEATATGYARSSGSFLDDDFRAGMELDASGFSNSENNGAKVIKAVTATTITVDGTVAEASAGGRKLDVGIPSQVAWENTHFDPENDKPWVDEDYLPGPRSQITLGKGGRVELTPQYRVLVHVPQNTGMYAARKYTDALLNLFSPGVAMAVGSDTLRVRADTGPFPGQLAPSRAGWETIPVTFPLRIRTANPN